MIALVAATVAACGGGSDQPSPSPATTPAPPATSTSTATASPPPTTTPATAPSPRATATASPSPTPVPATATPSPTAVAPAATTFSYNTYDTTGAVSTPGSYAFLSDPNDTSTVVTTYEALRDGTTTALLIHKSDAHGASQATFYDAVEASDTFEWHYAHDCWVGYRVTEVKADPTGTVPRKLLAVAPYAYAYTGCEGTIAADAAARQFWRELPSQGGESLLVPVVVGTFQVVPEEWDSRDGIILGGVGAPPGDSADSPVWTSSLEEARNLPYWRDLPGFTLSRATSGGLTDPGYGYCAKFYRENGSSYDSVAVCASFASGRTIPMRTDDGWGRMTELRVINGYPATVNYTRRTSEYFSDLSPIVVTIYDAETQSEHWIDGSSASTTSGNVEAVVEIARILFEDVPSGPGGTTFRYDTYDTTGAVSTPGSYAFLSDPGDTSTVVTTYEALRDGTTTALLIHTSDADGLSRADVYDAVEAGDLFEWRHADDCFVRYEVTEVKPHPTGTVPRKLLAVEWMTYAFTGCSGTISTSDAVQIVWGALPSLGGDSLTVPVIHGIYQIAPRDWDGTTREVVGKRPPRSSTATYTENIVVARTLDFWREPTVPEDWVFYWAGTAGAESVSGTTLGYCAEWAGRERSVPGAPDRKFRPRALEVCAHFAIGRYGEETASWNIVDEGVTTLGVHETRVVAGRPALFRYSPPGPQFDDYFPIRLEIFDPETEVNYTIRGRDDKLRETPEKVIAIGLSMFENIPPGLGATTFRYDTYDTTGAVSTPGSHTILTDSSSTTSAASSKGFLIGAEAIIVTTYDSEGNSTPSSTTASKLGTWSSGIPRINRNAGSGTRSRRSSQTRRETRHASASRSSRCTSSSISVPCQPSRISSARKMWSFGGIRLQAAPAVMAFRSC